MAHGRKLGQKNPPKVREFCKYNHSLTDPANIVTRISCLTCRRESMRKFRDKKDQRV